MDAIDPSKTIIRDTEGEWPEEDFFAGTEAPFQTIVREISQNRYHTEKLTSGDRIGRYEVIGLIAEGGISYIHKARHVYLDQNVALKTLKFESKKESDARKFLREAQTLALINHPNVIRVFDADIWQGIPYIVLELLEGCDVSNLLKVHNRLPINRTMDLLEDIGSVLAKQENKGILHLDIKPGNIFQRLNGSFCLFDYGLVDLASKSNKGKNISESQSPQTFYSQAFGTPAYMSPEQVMGKADHRSDLYSLGVTVWQCITGNRPRNANSISSLMETVANPMESSKKHRDEVPEELDHIISNLIQVSPDGRYQTAGDLLEDLKDYRYTDSIPRGPMVGSAFIAIPFRAEFNSVFSTIEKACLSEKLRPRRMDRIDFTEDIWNQTVLEIDAARVIVADFTGIGEQKLPNPNVVTEAAHGRAIGKKLILVTQDAPEQLPFDWRHMPVIRYATDRKGLVRLTESLTRMLKTTVYNT